MLTQPVLVARLSTHAWALGKGPALFRLRHRDGEKMWKSWVLPQECVCVCLCIMGQKCHHFGEDDVFCLIIRLPHCLWLYSISLSTSHTLTPPLSSGFLRAAVHGAESFIRFCACLFRIPGSSACPALVALQKQCIQFVSTKSVPATWQSTSKKGEACRSGRFKKAAGTTAWSPKQQGLMWLWFSYF